MSDLFLAASRAKLRFATVQGSLSVEDLWDLPLTTSRGNKASIESIGAELLQRQADLVKVQGASILGTSEPSPELEKVNLQVDILREVASIRQAENKLKTETLAKQSERDRLDELIREREAAELPLEELRAQRAALN